MFSSNFGSVVRFSQLLQYQWLHRSHATQNSLNSVDVQLLWSFLQVPQKSSTAPADDSHKGGVIVALVAAIDFKGGRVTVARCWRDGNSTTWWVRKRDCQSCGQRGGYGPTWRLCGCYHCTGRRHRLEMRKGQCLLLHSACSNSLSCLIQQHCHKMIKPQLCVTNTQQNLLCSICNEVLCNGFIT